MNIDEMPAGIELDILVAEALGYTRIVPFTIEAESPVSAFKVVSGGASLGDNDKVYIKRTADSRFTCFTPSTDIAAAWEIVEHLAELSIYLCIFDQLGYAVDEETGDVTNDCLFRVEFMNAMVYERDEPPEKVWYGIMEAVAAPLAICRAALKVMAEG